MSTKDFSLMIGKQYNDLTVESVFIEQKGKYKRTYMNCVCVCGKHVKVQPHELLKGHIKSCGCLLTRVLVERNTTHNKSRERLYQIYKDMCRRCYDPKRKAYKNYGGRGIKVCDEWKNNFMAFYNWASTHPNYTETMTLERIDYNGMYCPENCTWIPKEEQSKNRRINHQITINGETHHIAEWARMMNVKPRLIMVRIWRGWPEDKAVLTPIGASKD